MIPLGLLRYRATWDGEEIHLLAPSHQEALVAAVELAGWDVDARPALEMLAGCAWVPVEVRS